MAKLETVRDQERLSSFVKEAITAGEAEDQIRSAIVSAGWSRTAAEKAIGSWMRLPSGVVVPVPGYTPGFRDSPLLPLLLITLTGVLWGLVQASFTIIEHLLASQDEMVRHLSEARWSAALLIVLVPCLLVIDKKSRNSEGDDLKLTSFILGTLSSLSFITLAGSLVATIYGLLSGDVSDQFLAKATILCVISILVLGYRKNFRNGRARGMFVKGWGVFASVCVFIVIFMNGGLSEGRKERMDRIRMNDTSAISERIRCLSESREGFRGPLGSTDQCPGDLSLIDPGGSPYSVDKVSENSYRICTMMESKLYANQPCAEATVRRR